MAVATGITIEEFELLPEALAKNKELVNGELVDVSGNKGAHNRLRDLLISLLLPLVQERRLGLIVSEQEYEFEENAHGPDVSFIGPDKVHRFNNDRRVQLFVPDLAVEIVSSSDRFNSLIEKAERYRRCGTKQVWVLEPKTRQAFLFSEEGQVWMTEDKMFESKLIPGFSIRLSDLFDGA